MTLAGVIGVAGVCVLWRIAPAAGIAGAAFFLLLTGSFYLFTRKRYQDIADLSEYLASVYTGLPCMDIRDNREGELSILKNDIYKVTLTLSEQSALLKKDKQYLADTMSNISHQLKTPLTSMFVMTDLLSSPDLPEEKRETFLNNILNQLKRIEWLVSSLLKMSKIDAQAVQFKKEQVPVKKWLNQVIEPLRIPAELKGQTLEIHCQEELRIETDRNWTGEAILNIVKNCVEHTGEGGTVRITCTNTPLYTRLVISDDGEGISKEDLPHIFERFYKGKNAGPDSVGIGLAMAKTILNGQKADVSVESEAGAGTAFTVTFYNQTV